MKSLFAILLVFIYASSVIAMGGAPPKKEEPKYKLEILKMDIITTPTPSPEASTITR